MIGNILPGEYLIAVLLAAAVVVTFRPKGPRTLELAIWTTLVLVCILTIAANPNPQARSLTGATLWGAGRIVGMIAVVSWQGTAAWASGARFAIANATVFVVAVDVFALALVSTRRQANAWIPVTRLGEWRVLPRLRVAEPQPAAPSAIDEINRRFNSWGAAAFAATLAWSILLFGRWRRVELRRAARRVRGVSLVAVVAWRRVAGGRAQLGQVRISHMEAPPADPPPVTRSKRAGVKKPVPGTAKGPAKTVRKRSAKGKAGTARRKRQKRAAAITPVPVSRIDKNGSAKRPDRLAS